MIHFVSTKAVEATCHRCRTALLTGLDQGIPARVDAAPISPAAEVGVLLEGRWTYTLRAEQLIHRDARRIASGRWIGPIHAEHRCPPEYHQEPLPIGSGARP